MKWTHEEDAQVTHDMRQHVAHGGCATYMADMLSHTMPHSKSAILRRWYTVLSTPEERAKRAESRTSRVMWSGRFDAKTLTFIRAAASVLEVGQSEVIETALGDMWNEMNGAQRDAIRKLEEDDGK